MHYLYFIYAPKGYTTVEIHPLCGVFNPLSPNIQKQILQTDLHTFL